MKQQDIDRLTRELREYKEGRSNVNNTHTQIKELQRQLNEPTSQLRVTIPEDISMGHNTQVSQMTGVTQGHAGSNIMGGSNEQSQARNPQWRTSKIRLLMTDRKIGQATQIPNEAPDGTVANN